MTSTTQTIILEFKHSYPSKFLNPVYELYIKHHLLKLTFMEKIFKVMKKKSYSTKGVIFEVDSRLSLFAW